MCQHPRRSRSSPAVRSPPPRARRTAEWSAGEILTFYGGLLAAALAVFGIYWTIKDSHEQNKQEEKDRVRPYLALTELKQTFNLDSTGNDQECDSSDIPCYIEKRIDQGHTEAIEELKSQIRLYDNLKERAEYILERTTNRYSTF